MMEVRKLAINAALAGLYVFATAIAATGGDITEAALWGAGIAAVRAAIGYALDKLGATVPVDK